MPAGKLTATLTGSPALLERIAAPARVEIEVVGSRDRSAAPLCTRLSDDVQDPQWHQELSMSLAPAAAGGELRIALCGTTGTPIAEGTRSLETVYAEDVDTSSLELVDDEGRVLGTVELVLRLFHGRSALDRRSMNRSFSGMHRVSQDLAQQAY